MNTINRSAVVVIPAQPFLDWLHQADPTSAQLSLNDLRIEATLYLLPVTIPKKRRASICKSGRVVKKLMRPAGGNTSGDRRGARDTRSVTSRPSVSPQQQGITERWPSPGDGARYDNAPGIG